MFYQQVRAIRRMALLSVAGVALVVGTAQAAEAQKIRLEIAAQDLGSALSEFARQSRQQLLYSPEVVQGRRAPALNGEYDPQQALQLMLAGTGLGVRVTPSGAFLLTAAQGQEEPDLPPVDAPGEGADAEARAQQDDREIVVTGSIIRGAAPSGANLIVLRREDLDATGRGTLAEAIQTVPQVHGGGANDATMMSGIGGAPNNFGSHGGSRGASSLNLRGIGVEETLTLVNGRRLAPAGYDGAFADISALPMAAIERVEILADGASATYGADAMAGVVNIIMNRHFEGAETRLRAGLETRSGQPEFEASQTFGWVFDRGNILLSGNYARRDGVTAKGRPFAASQDLRPFGGSDRRLPYCSPGNITAPAELAGAIPAGQDGRALTPDQIRRGETNRCNLYPTNRYLTPETERGALYLAGSYDLTGRLRVTADVLASRRHTTGLGNYLYADLKVPVSNAFRKMNGLHDSMPLLNQTISVLYQFTEVVPRDVTISWSLMATMGADYKLGDDWQISLHSSYGRYDRKFETHVLDTRPASEGGRLEQALASSDPETALNPFGDSSGNRRGLVESLLYPFHSLQESDYRAVILNVGGSLFNLPAGSVKLAVGTDYRREGFDFQYRDFYTDLAPSYQQGGVLTASRNVKAAFAELFIPIFSERNAAAGARRVNVSLSGRYDHYSDFGGTFNPKAGVTWVPVDGLTLKGSYGTSFKAPLLRTLYEGSLVYSESAVRIGSAPDANGDNITEVMYVGGGNPDLGPEKGESWAAGIEIEPALIPGMRLHATYFNLRFTGRFADAPHIGLIFSEPDAYAGIVYFPLPPQAQVEKLIASADQVYGTMPPPGSIEAIINNRTMNFASQVVDGIDAGASYRWEGHSGTFSLSGDVSYLSRYKSRLGRSVAETSYVANVGLPTHWKLRGGLGWTGETISLNGWINHVSGYTNKMGEPYVPVSSYTTVDLSAQVQLDGWARGLVGDGVSLSIHVTNLLDQAPPFVNNYGIGYDGANADPVGRRIAVQLVKRW